MHADPWRPAQYERFRDERERPGLDLLALVRSAPEMRAVDLGCGTGRLTRRLHAELHARETVGIDRSSRMLETALADPLPPGLTFDFTTIESFAPRAGEYDLIFSNAAFHWIDDHEALLTRLAAALAPGGQLAFQVPAMHDDLSHTVAEALTDVDPFRRTFGGWHRPQPVLAPEAYAELLQRLGFAEQQVRLQVYPHVLDRPDEVVEWMKGTLLTDYQKRLAPEQFPQFVEAYRARLLPQLGNTRPFFFPFRRILCWARKSA